MPLFNFRAPALPLPPDDYNRQQFDEQARALRLYFNRLDGDLTTLINPNGGGNLSFPHISASDSTDQRTTDDTATGVAFDTLESASGWTLNSPGSATAQYPGVYTIRYSLQFANTDNAQHTATAWLKVNNADVANSATSFSVPARKSASIPGFTVGYSEVTFTVAAGDEIELYWATDQANVVSPAADGIFIFHDAAQASPFPRPAIPSVIGSITFVSALP
jgi:hypothetical protein